MKKTRSITIKINDTDIQLDQSSINFYLTETKKKKINKTSLEKFFTRLWTTFNS